MQSQCLRESLTWPLSEELLCERFGDISPLPTMQGWRMNGLWAIESSINHAVWSCKGNCQSHLKISYSIEACFISQRFCVAHKRYCKSSNGTRQQKVEQPLQGPLDFHSLLTVTDNESEKEIYWDRNEYQSQAK